MALAWLLHHAENIILIPGTSRVAHLEENLVGVRIDLSAEEMEALDAIGAPR